MYAQKKPIENTHIVREKDRQRNRELLAVLSLGVPIGFFLLVFAWQNLEVIRLGREATQLQKTLKEQETQQKQLQSELDRLTSFDAVEKQAGELGFEPAAPGAIVMVERGATAVSSRAKRSEVEGSLASGATRTFAGDPSTPLRSGRDDTKNGGR
jgi:cell division protein FtsB